MVLTSVAARRTRIQPAGACGSCGVVAICLNGRPSCSRRSAASPVTPVARAPRRRRRASRCSARPASPMMRAGSGPARCGSTQSRPDRRHPRPVRALLVVGDRLLTSSDTWFTVPTAVVAVSVTAGLVWPCHVRPRAPRRPRARGARSRRLATGTVNAWAMLGQRLHGFTSPAGRCCSSGRDDGPASCSCRSTSPGRPRPASSGCPPQAQVRRRVVVAITATAVAGALRAGATARGRHAVGTRGLHGGAAALVVLALVRQLLGSVRPAGSTRSSQRLPTSGGACSPRSFAASMRTGTGSLPSSTTRRSSRSSPSSRARPPRPTAPPGAPSRPRRGLGPRARRPRRPGRGPAAAHARGPSPGARRPLAQRRLARRSAPTSTASRRSSYPALDIVVDATSTSTGQLRRSLCASSRRRWATPSATPPPAHPTRRVTACDGLLEVRVVDDGDGFDPARAVRHGVRAGDDAELRRPRWSGPACREPTRRWRDGTGPIRRRRQRPERAG